MGNAGGNNEVSPGWFGGVPKVTRDPEENRRVLRSFGVVGVQNSGLPEGGHGALRTGALAAGSEATGSATRGYVQAPIEGRVAAFGVMDGNQTVSRTHSSLLPKVHTPGERTTMRTATGTAPGGSQHLRSVRNPEAKGGSLGRQAADESMPGWEVPHRTLRPDAFGPGPVDGGVGGTDGLLDIPRGDVPPLFPPWRDPPGGHPGDCQSKLDTAARSFCTALCDDRAEYTARAAELFPGTHCSVDCEVTSITEVQTNPDDPCEFAGAHCECGCTEPDCTFVAVPSPGDDEMEVNL